MRSLGWVLDLDGVVRLGTRRVSGSPEAIARLRAAGRPVVFATNNSNDTITEVQRQLTAMGVPVEAEAIVTSATAAATLVEAGERVLVCGGPGVAEAVRARGAIPLDGSGSDGGTVDAVMVGFHPTFDYDRMTVAVRAVLAGARLVATNDDRTFPTPDGLAPGAGAILGSIVAATGVEPTIAGKPHAPMAAAIETALARVGGDDGGPAVVVGDRADTDGALAATLGVEFALVLTGVARATDPPIDPAPVLIAADLASAVDQLVPSATMTARL